MTKRRIKNIDDLHAERERLMLEIASAEEDLKEDLNWLKEEFKPSNVAAGLIKNIFGFSKDKLFKNGVNLAIDVLLKNVLLSRAGWITRLIVPLFAKNISDNFISDKKPELYGILKNVIKKARKYTRPSESSFYDKSTVDEMDY